MLPRETIKNTYFVSADRLSGLQSRNITEAEFLVMSQHIIFWDDITYQVLAY